MEIYEDIYFTTELEELRENMMINKNYILKQPFKCDIQPILEKAIKYTWGSQIKSKLQMYCNENLNVDDVIVVDDITYKVEEKKDWKEYKVYAILECDIDVCRK
ncbi:hypothetical protein ACFO6R_08465 [Eubacterium multiforme]|uniref:Phage protein n=1 Tax=Eubacterium multiforme TaxID=83339 RepID=A0ABT9UUN0_9FIRM|nr:hypothetical protein [Eubacterium multiforme]MDQ0150036.1 hypothetical protein [Eubacterium multiforme]